MKLNDTTSTTPDGTLTSAIRRERRRGSRRPWARAGVLYGRLARFEIGPRCRNCAG
jgi:hypothetical protein